nr:MAG TPA: Protein of unknown function (DUF2755) [Inoviridae sp.]
MTYSDLFTFFGVGVAAGIILSAIPFILGFVINHILNTFFRVRR